MAATSEMPLTPGARDRARALFASTRHLGWAAMDLRARVQGADALVALTDAARFLGAAGDEASGLAARMDMSLETADRTATGQDGAPTIAVEGATLVDDDDFDNEADAIRAGCRELRGALGRVARAARDLRDVLGADADMRASHAAGRIADWAAMAQAAASRAEPLVEGGAGPTRPAI